MADTKVIGNLIVTRLAKATRINEDLTEITSSGAIPSSAGKNIRLVTSSSVTIQMPACNSEGVQLGTMFFIKNPSASNAIIVGNGASTTLATLPTGREFKFVCTNVDSPAGGWEVTELNAPSSSVSNYTADHLIADWSTTAVNNKYSFTIPVATHGFGLAPLVEIFELVSGNYSRVLIDIDIDSSGNVILEVYATPVDERFNFRVVIS